LKAEETATKEDDARRITAQREAFIKREQKRLALLAKEVIRISFRQFAFATIEILILVPVKLLSLSLQN
jgi:hypothetical protein